MGLLQNELRLSAENNELLLCEGVQVHVVEPEEGVLHVVVDHLHIIQREYRE
jgi:hypothetical protein